MANRTVKDAHSVKGTNPQYLVEKIIRTRIYESRYWKEECFALSAELMVDKAMELKYIGGVYGGNIKPSPFLCLVLKMLQIQPEKDIVVEFIKNEDFKYVRALGAMYMRLVGTSLDCYKYLEPLYLDYRKLRRMNRNGEFELCHMDEYIDELLRDERSFDVILPRIQKRQVLEETNQLEPRTSALDDDLEEIESSDEEDMDTQPEAQSTAADGTHGYHDQDRPRRSPSPRHRRSRSHSPHGRRRNHDHERDHDRQRDRNRDSHRDRDRDRDRARNRDSRRERDHDRDRRRSRSRSRDRHRSSGHKHRSEDDDRRRHRKSKRSKRDHRDKDLHEMSKMELEIQEANELRAKLGMAPLK